MYNEVEIRINYNCTTIFSHYCNENALFNKILKIQVFYNDPGNVFGIFGGPLWEGGTVGVNKGGVCAVVPEA